MFLLKAENSRNVYEKALKGAKEGFSYDFELLKFKNNGESRSNQKITYRIHFTSLIKI